MLDRFIKSFLNIGLSQVQDRLKYRRILLVNVLTLVNQGFMLVLVAIVMSYSLWSFVIIGMVSMVMLIPTYYFNYFGRHEVAALYLVNFCVIGVLVTAYFAFYELRLSETENWLCAFIGVSVFLFDGIRMRFHFWWISLALLGMKFLKFYLLDYPMDRAFVLLEVNSIILCLALYLFLLIFKFGLRRSLEKLKEADRMKNKLFSIVAHDLKSPFVFFETILQSSKTEAISKDQFVEFQGKLQERFEPIKNTVTELLEWAQAQMMDAKTEPVEFNPRDVIDQVPSSLNMLMEKKQLFFKVKGELSTLRMDKNHLTVIIRNLTHNAIKFSRNNTEIVLDLSENEEYHIVSVEDSGVGMTNEKINDILKNNLTQSILGTDGEKGTGIGLNLVKELIDRNNSKLEILSREGVGSKFTLHIPKSLELVQALAVRYSHE